MAGSSRTDIYNLALTLLGAPTVNAYSQNTRGSNAISAVYDTVRRGELRKKPNWNFSIKQIQLVASSTTPLFDKAYSYPLPGDYISLAYNFPESNYNDIDWEVSGGQLYTNYQSPLNVRYVYDVTDTSVFDPLFVEAFAAKLALVCADQITQSNSKLQSIKAAYDIAFSDAAKANAFDKVSQELPVDTYWTVRL